MTLGFIPKSGMALQIVALATQHVHMHYKLNDCNFVPLGWWC